MGDTIAKCDDIVCIGSLIMILLVSVCRMIHPWFDTTRTVIGVRIKEAFAGETVFNENPGQGDIINADPHFPFEPGSGKYIPYTPGSGNTGTEKKMIIINNDGCATPVPDTRRK
ncbi:MAG: hypothetical protein PVF73_02195 [Bacteroidales bacterium]|jgi:hypothetical protein